MTLPWAWIGLHSFLDQVSLPSSLRSLVSNALLRELNEPCLLFNTSQLDIGPAQFLSASSESVLPKFIFHVSDFFFSPLPNGHQGLHGLIRCLSPQSTPSFSIWVPVRLTRFPPKNISLNLQPFATLTSKSQWLCFEKSVRRYK